VSLSGAAILRRQTSGILATSNPRKMFDESQMVRRVRAYLASIKSKLITDEAQLSEMSARCEAPAQHPAQQPGAILNHSVRLSSQVHSSGCIGSVLGANYKKILRLSYDVIITYDNRKSNLR